MGSARTALASYLAARGNGGRFILRIEDLDTARTVPGATAAILYDLRWLGLDWDEGPDVGGQTAPYLQSQRRALYDAALAQLRASGKVYPCACSRRDIEQAAQAPHGVEPVYPGFCRGRDPDEVIAEARKRGRGVAWRFAVRSGVVQIWDAVFGSYTQDVQREVGDFVVYRADGVPAYQLAVVVDDIAMGITQVVRGDDLLASTPRQVLLYEAFGATPPRYLHVPLVVGDDGVRLAKRHGSISIAELRRKGVAPSRLLRALLESLGIPGESRHPVLDPSAIPRAPLPLAALRRLLPEIA